MVDFLYIAATLQKLAEDPAKPDSAFLKLEIAKGDIFRIDSSMLQELCEELKNGVGLIECGRTEDLLPYGISRNAKIENDCLSTIIEVPKGLNLGRHSYASTDGLIRVCAHGIVRHFSIGLVDVICQCNICNELLSSEVEGHCTHLPGQEFENGEVSKYTIKGGQPIFVSAESVPITEYENIQLLLEDWGLDGASLIEAKINALDQSEELSKAGSAKDKNSSHGLVLSLTRSHPVVRRRTRRLRGRHRSDA